MISQDKYFAIWYANGDLKLRGQTGELDFVLLNTAEGETYEYGTEAAVYANQHIYTPIEPE